MVEISKLGSKNFEGTKVTIDWVRDVSESDNVNYKKRVIERALIASRLGSSSAQCFLYNCYLSYNPFYVYHLESVPDSSGMTERENPWIEFWGLLEDLRTKMFSSYRAVEVVEDMMKRFDSDEWNIVAKPVILKNFLPGVSIELLNSVLRGTEWQVPVFSCQQSVPYGDVTSHLSGIKWLEPRVQGTRVIAVITNSAVVLHDNSGNVLTGYTNIENDISLYKSMFSHESKFGSRFVIDGVIGSGNSKKERLYYMFDILPLSDFINGFCEVEQIHRREVIKTVYEHRIRWTQTNLRALTGMQVDLNTAEGYDIMHRYAESMAENGIPSIIIKGANDPYRAEKENAWISKSTHIPDGLQ